MLLSFMAAALAFQIAVTFIGSVRKFFFISSLLFPRIGRLYREPPHSLTKCFKRRLSDGYLVVVIAFSFRCLWSCIELCIYLCRLVLFVTTLAKRLVGKTILF